MAHYSIHVMTALTKIGSLRAKGHGKIANGILSAMVCLVAGRKERVLLSALKTSKEILSAEFANNWPSSAPTRPLLPSKSTTTP